MNMSQIDDSSEMLGTLAKIMDKFDVDELKDNPGVLDKPLAICENNWIRF